MGISGSNILNHPFAAAPTASAMTATGDQTVSVTNALTFIDGATTQATGNRTLILSIGSEVKAGAIILLTCKSNGTETLTFSTGITDAVHTGVAGKTFAGAYMYNGTVFLPMGELQQID
jgi:hypothetical protein